MAQTVITRYTDDLDGSEAEGNVEFGFEGKHFEIDLSGANKEALAAALTPFIEKARKLTGTKAPKAAARKSSGGGAGSADKERNTAIREWAAEQGMTTSTRGRISAEVQAAYAEAHPGA